MILKAKAPLDSPWAQYSCAGLWPPADVKHTGLTSPFIIAPPVQRRCFLIPKLIGIRQHNFSEREYHTRRPLARWVLASSCFSNWKLSCHFVWWMVSAPCNVQQLVAIAGRGSSYSDRPQIEVRHSPLKCFPHSTTQSPWCSLSPCHHSQSRRPLPSFSSELELQTFPLMQMWAERNPSSSVGFSGSSRCFVFFYFHERVVWNAPSL